LHPRLGDVHNPFVFRQELEGVIQVKYAKRLAAALGSVVALLLAGAANWKIG